MAIPEKPLVIKNYNPDEWTLLQNRIAYRALRADAADDLLDFLLKFVDHEQSWTDHEIFAIKRSECDEVRKQLRTVLEQTKLPLPN